MRFRSLAQRLARSGRFAAVVACALVVDGGIYRHDFVAPAVVDALMRVQLDSGVPVFSVVLTPKDYHEHATHRDFFSRHFVEKGAEAARACHQTLAVHAELDAATELDDGDPEEFGRLHAELARLVPGLRVVGGCCGTDHRHVGCVSHHLHAGVAA